MNDLQENPFEIEVNAPSSLNYLLFMQNVFLNQQNKQIKKPLFPYLDSSKWGLLEKEKFQVAFRDIWEEVASKIAVDRTFDHYRLFDNQKELSLRLFCQNEAGDTGYLESVKAFLAWWETIAGKIAIEKVFDVDHLSKIYEEMALKVKPTKEHSRLLIDLVYDRPLLPNEIQQSWYIIIPIEDVFIQKHSGNLLQKLLDCCKR